MPLSLLTQSVDNTGELTGDKSKGVLKKLFITSASFAAADYASNAAFLAKLVEYSKLSKTASNKVFVLNEVQDIQDASEANAEGTLGLGFKATIREGKPAYNLKSFAGADLLGRLRTFNNQTLRVFEFDANDIMWGTKSGTTFIGYQVKFFFDGGKAATGQNIEEGIVNYTMSILDNSEYKNNPYWIEVEGNIGDVKALSDVTLGYVSNASNVYKIDMKIIGTHIQGGYNIYDNYGAAIAAMAANFSAGTGTNFGTPLTITSIATDAALKCLTVTFDSTAFTALAAGTKIRLNPPTPAQLDTADVPELELLSVIVTK